MNSKRHPEISIKGAKTNNLKNLTLKIPHNKFIVVTGVSGSGKSSLAFEVVAKEGQRRYFETLPSFARQFMGKLNRTNVDEIEGLSPVIAVGQKTSNSHARSIVGTLSDIYDLLRLLYARTGVTDRAVELSRALFSFNSIVGKCEQCNGIGKLEKIDFDKLIDHPEKTIREGALAPTLPTGYIMYSQVTIDVLNQVCNAEGFNVDIPWKDLDDRQKKVILYGSDKIKVPFGKHSLESRLNWTGIKAKPREEGHYKGMIPIMSDILRRDRNANILKYVHSVTCDKCNGARLNQEALSVTVFNKTIADIITLELNELKRWIKDNDWDSIGLAIVRRIESQIDLLIDLGLGHLAIDRPSNTLRASEIQRIRIANQILVPLSDVLYVFDEPSIGLHPDENERLIFHLKRLVTKGNTVIVVEHDLKTIQSADHIVEIGPRAGVNGGEVVFNGRLSDFIKLEKLSERSPTYRALAQANPSRMKPTDPEGESVQLKGCIARNLKGIDVEFKLGKLNVVSGRSGSGKSSLVKDTLMKVIQNHLDDLADINQNVSECKNINRLNKLIFIDHTPIGKTPRSNPATYLGISDHIRDLYAKLPESKKEGFTKSRFSFNNKGGRCESCQGAGKTQIGMHFMGNVDLVCGSCNGDRFNAETLAVKYRDLSIADCYRLSVDQAITFFEGEQKILNGLLVLQKIGLGYLQLGQSSTTVSGGEAQRIKIANQLQKKDTGNTLYIIIEPTIGLHHDDINTLLSLFEGILQSGNTIVCIEQDETVIGWSDWHVELGPGNGANGGNIVWQGPRRQEQLEWQPQENLLVKESVDNDTIILKGVSTHGLKDVDVTIPKKKLTIVTGLSGSGKSSLVFDTLFAESNARFTESLSTYNRSFLKQNSTAKLISYHGLGPVIGIRRSGGGLSNRSTVGTASGVYDALRLLYSRIAQNKGLSFTAQHFSFNDHLGACAKCKGLGTVKKCNAKKVIIDAQTSILNWAVINKALRYYTDPNGQFIATLNEVARHYNWDVHLPWNELPHEAKEIVLYGAGEKEWDVEWKYSTKSRSGVQKLKAKWLGLCNYIHDEYDRKLHNKNISSLQELMHDVVCPTCEGSRLKSELLTTQFRGKDISELTQLSISKAKQLIDSIEYEENVIVSAVGAVVLPNVSRSLAAMQDLGLGYLTLDRSLISLSGGERQRVTLAGQLSSHLFGVTYVLDEPTIGLDAGQVDVLIRVLDQIIKRGNTVIVIEHDPSFMSKADYIIEMGPGAGKLGGEVVYQGRKENLIEDSLTYTLLHASENLLEKVDHKRGKAFGIIGANANNLKNIDVDFHAKQLTAVRGVSGSGKSSLIKEVLYQSWVEKSPAHCTSTFGLDQFIDVQLIDQKVISSSRLSTVASYTGVLDFIKKLFANTDSAKEAGLKSGDFSYLSKRGKCPSCSGHGQLKTSMDFMNDIWLTCPICNGGRYHLQIKEHTVNNRSVDEVLSMTINEFADFTESKVVLEKLKVLQKVGVGHLHLGQSTDTLSGGEAQRLKLCIHLMKTRNGATLYLIDEPSTGLHYYDIVLLLEVFNAIVERGDTVVFIEHNQALVEAANDVITLGPGSGDAGGRII